MTKKPRSECAIAGTLDILGDRWSLLIVRDLLIRGELRYGDFMLAGEQIPTNTLADRLRKLEEAGILTRTAYQDNPPRYSYRLTDKGRALDSILDAMVQWGLSHIPGTRRLDA
ncbi:helix-turn-helix transcriptional regulator [Nocardia sp. NEAU-G5]|uniref:Helix-turn-helix transcriptional regulator n=1 Tax=Nocardia albiluteola TaxID=2842303 RepID=A0ABS6AZA3_9NOCA|nr:helix-turn-helix domain-containing protein [Nocardia albiluteola]MBU3063378.1 helix-turn-helix transcriptional regulator [Nocardia albiluteola]